MDEVRRNWPFLRDRRIDAYSPIVKTVAWIKVDRRIECWRMPAEWEPHEATWLAWPHERSDWPGKFAPIPWVYGDIVRRLARVERSASWWKTPQQEKRPGGFLPKCGVEMQRGGVLPLSHESKLDARLLSDLCSQSERAKWPSPNWLFNGWAKYDNWRADNDIPRRGGEAPEGAANLSRASCWKAAAST